MKGIMLRSTSRYLIAVLALILLPLATGCFRGGKEKANNTQGEIGVPVQVETALQEMMAQTLTVTGTIKAEHEQEIPEGYKAHRKELINKHAVRRSFNLGKEIDADGISAKLESGILMVTLPKTEKVLPRRIEVK